MQCLLDIASTLNPDAGPLGSNLIHTNSADDITITLEWKLFVFFFLLHSFNPNCQYLTLLDLDSVTFHYDWAKFCVEHGKAARNCSGLVVGPRCWSVVISSPGQSMAGRHWCRTRTPGSQSVQNRPESVLVRTLCRPVKFLRTRLAPPCLCGPPKEKVWLITREHMSPLLWGPVAACGPPLQLMLCMALSDLLLGWSYSAIERCSSWVNLKATQSLKVCGYRLC